MRNVIRIGLISLEDHKVMDLLQTLVDGINKRFDVVNERFDNLEQKFDKLEGRFDKLEAQNKLEHQQLMQAITEVDNTRFEIRRIK